MWEKYELISISFCKSNYKQKQHALPKFSVFFVADSGLLYVSTSVVRTNLVQLERCGNPETPLSIPLTGAKKDHTAKRLLLFVKDHQKLPLFLLSFPPFPCQLASFSARTELKLIRALTPVKRSVTLQTLTGSIVSDLHTESGNKGRSRPAIE